MASFRELTGNLKFCDDISEEIAKSGTLHIDIENNQLILHDGVTSGGIVLASAASADGGSAGGGSGDPAAGTFTTLTALGATLLQGPVTISGAMTVSANTPLTLGQDPVDPLDACTRQYTDAQIENVMSSTGSAGFYYYNARTNNTAETDPGKGNIEWNTATQSDATHLYIANISSANNDLIPIWRQSVGQQLLLQRQNDSTINVRYTITGIVEHGTWFTLNVTPISSAGLPFTGSANLIVVIGTKGGGIDGIPIGATTPSTGAFTTVTASGIGTFSSVVATSSSEVSTLVQLTTTSRVIGSYRHTINTPSWSGGGPLQGFTWSLNLVANSGTFGGPTISFGPDPSYGSNVAYMIIERYQNKLVFAGVDSSGTETDLLTLRTAPDALLATLSAPVSMTSTLAVTGASTLTGALVANGAVSGTGMTNRFATPGAIGSTTASTGAFTTLTTSGATTHNAAVVLNSGVSTLSPGAAKTGASYSVSANDTSLILAPTGTFTLTLPAASPGGRLLFLKLTAAFAVNSASANVVPLAGGAAATVIMSGTAGSFCMLQSDGTNWQIMNAN